MAKVTVDEEWKQYREHKFEPRKTAEDKAYETFINVITDDEGNLNKIGTNIIEFYQDPTGQLKTKKIHYRRIPERIIQICRVYNPLTNSEYLVYDVEQWGYLEDGGPVKPIHIQDIGTYREFQWDKKPQGKPIFTGTPQKTTFEWDLVGNTIKYTIPFNKEEFDKLKHKMTPVTRLYIYDSSVSGRGGKTGKIGVQNVEDFLNRPFKELMDGSYLLKTRLEHEYRTLQIQKDMIEQEKRYLEMQRAANTIQQESPTPPPQAKNISSNSSGGKSKS